MSTSYSLIILSCDTQLQHSWYWLMMQMSPRLKRCDWENPFGAGSYESMLWSWWILLTLLRNFADEKPHCIRGLKLQLSHSLSTRVTAEIFPPRIHGSGLGNRLWRDRKEARAWQWLLFPVKSWIRHGKGVETRFISSLFSRFPFQQNGHEGNRKKWRYPQILESRETLR